jgi:hypothetical protein
MDPKNPHEAIRIKELQKDALGLCSFFQITNILKHPIMFEKGCGNCYFEKKIHYRLNFFCSFIIRF